MLQRSQSSIHDPKYFGLLPLLMLFYGWFDSCFACAEYPGSARFVSLPSRTSQLCEMNFASHTKSWSNNVTSVILQWPTVTLMARSDTNSQLNAYAIRKVAQEMNALVLSHEKSICILSN